MRVSRLDKPIVPVVVKDTPLKKIAKKAPLKPKQDISLNKDKWASDGFASVLRNECNKCEQVCWHTKGDPGGMTCLGFATRDNSDLFIGILNHAWKMCKEQPIYNPIPSNAPFGIFKHFCYRMRTAYWDRYISKYKGCYYPAMIHLSDTAIHLSLIHI